jgi:hypothetical protein
MWISAALVLQIVNKMQKETRRRLQRAGVLTKTKDERWLEIKLDEDSCCSTFCLTCVFLHKQLDEGDLRMAVVMGFLPRQFGAQASGRVYGGRRCGLLQWRFNRRIDDDRRRARRG